MFDFVQPARPGWRALAPLLRAGHHSSQFAADDLGYEAMPFFAQMHRVAIKIQIFCDDARIHKFLSRIVIVDLVLAQEAVDHSLRQKVRLHHGPYLSLVAHHEDLKGNSSSGKLLSDLLERAQRRGNVVVSFLILGQVLLEISHGWISERTL